jgi:hypothetical protein
MDSSVQIAKIISLQRETTRSRSGQMLHPQLSIGQSSRSVPKGWTLAGAYGLYRPTSHIKLACKYLGFQAIWFKFHDRIKHQPISFQSTIPRTAQGDKRLCVSRWSTKLCPTSNKRPRLTQGAYFRSHARSVNQRVQISQGLLIDVPNHHIFYTCSTAYKKEGGSRSTLHTSSIIFSTCFVAYKEQGAP